MIKTELRGRLAIATLDREPALNSLNLEMARELAARLTAWQADPAVSLILLEGAGPRAFCAGGDVKTVVQRLLAGEESYATDFFTTEYRLDHLIHVARKPVMAVGHGYMMGGGIGLWAGAALRVVTGSSQLAMPELSIGLFPDVGASHFLNRLPGRLGLFCALTATRLNAGDALGCGLANAFVPDDARDEFRARLERLSHERSVATAGDAATEALKIAARLLAGEATPPAPRLLSHLPLIDAVLAGDDPRAALGRLAQLASHDDPVLAQAAQTFAAGSPTSALVIWEQLRRGAKLTLSETFRQDLDLAIQCCRRHDFREGVRAVLIEKDHRPRWRPGSLGEVSAALVAEHFESPWKPENHPLRDL